MLETDCVIQQRYGQFATFQGGGGLGGTWGGHFCTGGYGCLEERATFWPGAMGAGYVLIPPLYPGLWRTPWSTHMQRWPVVRRTIALQHTTWPVIDPCRLRGKWYTIMGGQSQQS